jgi:pimeloyl-ACP methyl ester carboxylesterase
MELTVRTFGDPDDPPAVYWHGLGPRGSADLLPAGEALASAAGVHLVAPDAPGFGGSPVPAADAYRGSRLADLFPVLLDELGAERATWIGWSWGGSIGCHVAARHPGRLLGLALLDSGYSDPRPEEEEGETEAEFLAFARKEWEAMRVGDWEAAMGLVQEDRGKVSPDAEASWREAWVERNGTLELRVSPEAFAYAFAGIVGEPPSAVWPEVAASGVPVLLLAQEDADTAAFRGAVPGAKVVPIAGSSHDVIADRPDVVVETVGDWLRSL